MDRTLRIAGLFWIFQALVLGACSDFGGSDAGSSGSDTADSGADRGGATDVEASDGPGGTDVAGDTGAAGDTEGDTLVDTGTGTDTPGDTQPDTGTAVDTASSADTDTAADGGTDTAAPTDTDTGTDGDTHTADPPVRTVTFVESNDVFPNPERGFHKYTTLTNLGGIGSFRDDNITLIYGRIDASGYRDQPFSDGFLQDIENGFAAARAAGLKVNPRVMYTESTSDPDAPLDVVLGHIAQLAPVWQANADVINVLDPGFIGAWGEWHSSSNNLDSEANMNAIIDALLAALPKDRMIVVRQPRFKRRYLSSATDTDAVLSPAQAFDQSPIARIGHLNDCFLSSPDDMGTYTVWPIEQELDYLEQESRYLPYGGETCAVHARNDCSNALVEMEKVHINYLNIDYNGDVIAKWRSQGCFDEIERRLGYRFVLTEAQVPLWGQRGAPMRLQWAVRNVGFGELFNPRPVMVVLRNNATGQEVSLATPVDPRFWGAGQTATESVIVTIPATLEAGTYTVALRLPDASETLAADSRYAVRFANQAVWDGQSGFNILVDDFVAQ